MNFSSYLTFPLYTYAITLRTYVKTGNVHVRLRIVESEKWKNSPILKRSLPWLHLSTEPWLCECLGFPCTIFNSGHMLQSSLMTLLANSLPLLLCRILGALKIVKMSKRTYATYSALLDFNGRSWTNLVKWSWYMSINLYCSSACDCISIRSTWHFEFI